jgi:hypothetical protein
MAASMLALGVARYLTSTLFNTSYSNCCGVVTVGAVAVGVSIPIFAVNFQQRKAGLM